MRWRGWLLCVVGVALGPRAAWPLDEATARRALGVAADKLAASAAALSPRQGYPKSTGADGTWRSGHSGLVPAGEPIAWTQGFFPGSLWLLHEWTDEARWRALAETWTAPLAVQQTNTQTHDLGFKLMLSFGHAYRLTGKPEYREVLLTSARSLASRFEEGVGILSCCDWNSDWQLPLVTDTMVNLELLLWGAANGGEARWRAMALSHARVTLRDMVRSDGSAWHVVDYERESGRVRSKETFQGYADTSTWARGHAWAVYGFTLVYRYTRDAGMLEAARRTADHFLDRLPPDGVPLWDFDAPAQARYQKKDSSAAAVVTSGLLELATFVDSATGQRYREAALHILDALTSSAYLAGGGSQAVLLHGVGHLPAGQEVDVGLVYGDYYFLEALLRTGLASPPPAGPPPPSPPPASPPPASPPPASPPPASPPPSTEPPPTSPPLPGPAPEEPGSAQPPAAPQEASLAPESGGCTAVPAATEGWLALLALLVAAARPRTSARSPRA